MAKQYEKHPDFSKYPHSAIQARSLGEMYFYTGKRCSKGHLSLKYASSGNCVKCIEQRRGTVEINVSGKSTKRSAENQRRAEDAFSKGLTTYEPETPCKHGHSERYVGTNNCVKCNLEASNKRKEHAKWLRVKKEYGITKDDFFLMKKSQHSKCSICSTDLNEKNTHIDHCHKTGKVRSLLCSRCNQAIGLLDEDLQKIQKAADYIRSHDATEGISNSLDSDAL